MTRKIKKYSLAPLLAIVLCVLLVGTAVFFLTADKFYLSSVEIIGNRYVSSEEIADDLGLTSKTHLVRYMISHLLKNEQKSLKLKNIDVYVLWPNKVRIEVEEENFVGLISFQGSFLCVNRQGIVIDDIKEKIINIPEIIGLEVGSFSLGYIPITEDNGIFTAVMEIATIVNKYGLTEAVNQINIRHLDDIVLYTENLEVHCGNNSDMDYKVALLNEFIKRYSDMSGILHLENPDGQVYLETK